MAPETTKKELAMVTSRAERPTSFQVAEIPVPHGREEEWRFTPISRISALFAEKLTGPQPQISLGDRVLAAIGDSVKLSATSREADRPAATDAQATVRLVETDPLAGTVNAPSERPAVVAWENHDRVLSVRIGKGLEVTEPVIINVTGAGLEAAAQHICVHAEAGSKALVILEHAGSAILTQGIEVQVDDQAELELVSIQEWERDAIHASNHRMRVGQDAKLKHIVVTFGGDLVRICPEVEYEGEGGEAELLGLYFTDSGQHQEHRLFVHHTTRNCVSNVNYKGALHGEQPHSVWIGDVLIGKDAFGTDSYEQNRNLVLNEGAKSDSVPNLEIENGDIAGAGHASATGRFDDEQLFYLQARGISEAEARRLVVLGFFGELINQIGIESLQERLLNRVESQLQKGPSKL